MSSHLFPALPYGLFPSGFLPKIMYAFLICPMCATCLNHLILNLIILIFMKGTNYEALEYKEFIFWGMTLYSLSKSANILEEHVSSIFRVRE